MVAFDKNKDKERRKGLDRRQYDYSKHIPERRSSKNRRNTNRPVSDGKPVFPSRKREPEPTQ